MIKQVNKRGALDDDNKRKKVWLLYSWIILILFKMDKNKKKNQFQIRKIPFRKMPAQKNPELYALDVHSICLPSRARKIVNWGNIHSNHYQEQYNLQIIYSTPYQQLRSQFLALKQQLTQQRLVMKQQIQSIEGVIKKEQDKEDKLKYMRQGLYNNIQILRQNLNQIRDKNYNLRWEIYHQRGPQYMSLNGYSLLHGPEMTYEELIQMEEQIGNVPKGLTELQIRQIPLMPYRPKDSNPEICCICFDELIQNQLIPSISCHHSHHRQCLKDWLLKQRVCPICKQEVNGQ